MNIVIGQDWERHPLVLRRVPVEYSGDELLDIMQWMQLDRAAIASYLRCSKRTVVRMMKDGVRGPSAAALNALIRLRMTGTLPTEPNL